MYELIFNGTPIKRGTVQELFGYLSACLGDVTMKRISEHYKIQPVEAQ